MSIKRVYTKGEHGYFLNVKFTMQQGFPTFYALISKMVKNYMELSYIYLTFWDVTKTKPGN